MFKPWGEVGQLIPVEQEVGGYTIKTVYRVISSDEYSSKVEIVECTISTAWADHDSQGG